MQHFPIFVSTTGTRVVLSGGADAAIAKLRLLLKTEAHLAVYSPDPSDEIVTWAEAGRLSLFRRELRFADLEGALLVYAANDDAEEDARVGALARNRGVLVNLVDNLADSAFITPCIVDRDPVTVAIGTEGAAPVLARAIKADIEERLPSGLGLLARIGKGFREHAEALPMGRKRRDFWRDYYFRDGPRALRDSGEAGIGQSLDDLLSRHLSAAPRKGRVDLVGAGPGDPELLTMRARRLLDEADVVLHDRLVAPEIIELARREALILETGKEGFGKGITQDEINGLMIRHAREGAQVVRLKAGDPSVFGRLDEEIEALDAAGVEWSVTPGITAASAGAASAGASLTRRNRNSGLRLLSAHDTEGFADHDWQALARPGEVAAFYMAKRAARFLQGRLLMHGADPATPVTIVEYASRRNERRIASTLRSLSADLDSAGLTGPAILLFGLASRASAEDFETPSGEEIAL